MSVLPFAAALAPVQQHYLLEARQMQALSFAAHVPLVCFGIAFPAFVVFVEWLHRRTGDPIYRVLARRYLAGHAPAGERDLAKWAGLPLRDARAGLNAIATDLAEATRAAPVVPSNLLPSTQERWIR